MIYVHNLLCTVHLGIGKDFHPGSFILHRKAARLRSVVEVAMRTRSDLAGETAEASGGWQERS